MTITYSDKGLCTKEDDVLFEQVVPRIEVLARAAHDHTYSSPETALAAPSDTRSIARVEATADALVGNLRLVLIVGIGGSDLGARAIYDALLGYRAVVDPTHTPRLIFIESVEPEILERLDSHLSDLAPEPEHIAVVVASKSGETVETVVNAAVVLRSLEQHYGPDASSRVIVITNEGSPLAVRAKEDGLTVLTTPREVPGRFSVGTIAGLLPLALAGISIESFAYGMTEGVVLATQISKDNPAARHAFLLYHHATKHGVRTHDLFLFHPELETLGKWYRQLLAESIGKEKPDTKERIGIAPSVVIGTTDLHSVIQLVFAGPRDRFTTFVAAPNAWAGPEVPSDRTLLAAPALLGGRSAGAVNVAIYEGVKRAYEHEGLRYCEEVFSELSAEELGRFMAIHMASIMYLAELFGVNPFDQPAVERYKEEVRRIMGNTQL